VEAVKLESNRIEDCAAANFTAGGKIQGPRVLVAYADGACEPVNPGGTATWGVVVYDAQGQELVADCGVIVRGPGATNNVAEFAAAACAMQLVRALGCPRGSHLTLHGDSQLWVRMLNGIGRPRTLDARYVPYYEQAREELARLRAEGVRVTITWVPREQNQRADSLSKQALEAQA
jgi:ribonuclease HI